MADNTPLPQDTAPITPDQAPQQEDTVQVVNEDGDLGTIPSSQLGDAVQSGYQVATPEHIAAYQRAQQYGTTGQQIATGLEGAASAATFGLSTGAEQMFGISNAEDIRQRRAENPGSYMAGQVAGLIGSTLLGNEAGAASLLREAGEAGAAAVGLGAPVSTLAKVGSAATRASIENMLFQSGDEVSRMLAKDPNQSIETAAADIGMAGLIGAGVGAGFGSISPLWKATAGPKINSLLQAIRDKTGGVEGELPVKSAMDSVIATSGMDLPPEIRAGLSNDPQVQNMFKTLEQSDTTESGRALQESYNKFRNDAGESLAGALGKSPSDLEGMELSKYESGKKIGNTLADEYKAQIDPLAEEYDVLREKTADEPLTPDKTITTPADYSNPYEPSSGQVVTHPGTASKLADAIASKAQAEGWTALPNSDIMSEINKVLKVLPEQETIGNLSKLSEAVGSQMQKDRLGNGPLYRAGGIIKGLIRDAEASAIGDTLHGESPALLQRFSAVREAYSKQAALKEALDDRLHIGGSTAGYAKAIREMASTDGESVVNRLNGKNDADVLNLLQSKFPKTAAAVRNYHIDNIVKNAVDKAKPGMSLNSQALLKSINSMSPELRSFAIPEQSLAKINAVGTMLEHFNKLPHNFSNTARTVDSLMSHIPGSVTGIATMLLGHNPATALAVGYLTKALGKDVPDAARLAMLKYLGSSEPVSASAFKRAADMIQSMQKGEKLLSGASSKLFQAAKDVLPESAMPSSDEIQKLDKNLKKLQTNPSLITRVAENTSAYMPEHGVSMGQMTARAVQYLNSLRPDVTPKAPLDGKAIPNSTQVAQYNRALKIAQQPLIVLDKCAKGSLTPQDVQHLQAMYPNLADRIRQKLTNDMATSVSKGKMVPYNTRICLSMLMAQPMDSSITPQGIMNAQPIPTPPTQPQAPTKNKRNTSSLGKNNSLYRTPAQSAEQDRGSRE